MKTRITIINELTDEEQSALGKNDFRTGFKVVGEFEGPMPSSFTDLRDRWMTIAQELQRLSEGASS